MMDFKTMETAALEERRAAIITEMETEGADLDALKDEARAILEEIENRRAEAKKKAEVREKVTRRKTP